MNENIMHSLRCAFAEYTCLKTHGDFACALSDTDPDRLRELIAVFVSEAEAALIDIYGVDQEEKQPDERR